jgi:hypothetical protein
LTIQSSLDLASSQLTYTGPGQVEYVSTSTSAYALSMVTEGIYYFTGNVRDQNNNLYQDTIAITVQSKTELDGLLRSKWEGMRGKLSSGDIEGALVYFHDFSKDDYRQLFNVLSPMLSTISGDMSDINFMEYHGDTAIYDIRATRDGLEYSFQLLFMKDPYGIWRITSF